MGRLTLNSVLLDTHAWAWSLTGDDRLSEKASSVMTNASSIFVSPISFFEIGQKVRLGKWPEMADHVEHLKEILEKQGGLLAALEARICLRASTMAWNHSDPFDRILAASAAHYNLPILSADTVFDGVVTRLW